MKLSELIEKLEEIQEKCYGDPECFVRFPSLCPITEENFSYELENKDNHEEVVFG